ncbi:GnsA/GnsB family [Citrobacter freundii]|nr:GnsA/GnsB family [Citrobacter freundii]
MNVEDLKRKTEADISEFITKKIIELKKKDRKRSFRHPVYCP